MPRTRQVKKAPEPEITTTLMQHDADLNETINAILKLKKETLESLELAAKHSMLSISSSVLNMKVGELKQKNGLTWPSFSNQSTFHSMFRNNTTSTTKKISANDEGYLTSESSSGSSGSKKNHKLLKRDLPTSESPPPTKAKRSRSLSKTAKSRLALPPSSTVTKSTRRTRSTSRSHDEEMSARPSTRRSRSVTTKVLTNSNKQKQDQFKTPINNKKISSIGYITPKIKQNAPQVVFRRPQLGEMAVSLQGSPLMTTAVVTETTANLNIPLPDGRLINIQPLAGLEPGELPQFDPETCRQLETLKENLDKICMYSNYK